MLLQSKSFIYAIGLHLAVLSAFTFKFHTSNQPLELVPPQLLNQQQPDIIQATAVSQTIVDAQINAIRRAEEQRVQAEIDRQKAIQRAAAERKAEEQRQQREQALAEQRAREEEQRRAAEAQVAQEREAQTQLAQYSQQLLGAIAREWIIFEGINRNLSARFYIKMARDGTVETVRLIESSGDSRLDQSARNAILKASPLPVPQSPTLYEQVKEINLTVSPREILRY